MQKKMQKKTKTKNTAQFDQKQKKISIYEIVENPAEAELQTNCDGNWEHLWGQMIND